MQPARVRATLPMLHTQGLSRSPQTVPTNCPHKHRSHRLNMLVSSLCIRTRARKAPVLGGGGIARTSGRRVISLTTPPRRHDDTAPEATSGAGLRHHDALFGKAGRMQPEIGHPVVSVFRSRLLEDAETNGYGVLAARMEARARAMPGFIDFKSFVAGDGERLSVIVFDTIAHQHAWRDDPEHRVAQQRGRDTFYSEYSISVCQELARRSFQAERKP